MVGSEKSDKISTFLTSSTSNLVQGLQEEAGLYALRLFRSWANGDLGFPPVVRILENDMQGRTPRFKLFLPLCGTLHLDRGSDAVTVDSGELGVVLDGGGHGEFWQTNQEGHYLHLFLSIPAGRVSLNVAGSGGPFGLPEQRKAFAGASFAHSDSRLLENQFLYLSRHPDKARIHLPALADVMLSGISLHQIRGTSQLVRKAIDRILHNPCHPELSVQETASVLGCHPDTLSRRFREETGSTFMGAVRDVRMQIASDLLAGGGLPVGEVALLCGYHDHSYFTRVYRQHHGCAPSQAKRVRT